MSAKIRVDQLLIEQGLVSSIDEAMRFVMAGCVYIGTKQIRSAAEKLSKDSQLIIKKAKEHGWVSRGGIKLDHAISHFNLDVKDKIAIDVGSSTGGFTDVLLYYGATKVYCVDVGYGELAWKLRKDPRVVLMERTNAKYLNADQFSEKLDIVVCDASFISLKQVLVKALELVKDQAILVALIKPQFEVEAFEVGEKGIVTDSILHQRVCEEIKIWLNSIPNWKVIEIISSPITGTKGNKEFLIYAMHNKKI